MNIMKLIDKTSCQAKFHQSIWRVHLLQKYQLFAGLSGTENWKFGCSTRVVLAGVISKHKSPVQLGLFSDHRAEADLAASNISPREDRPQNYAIPDERIVYR